MKRAFVIGHPIGHSRSPMIHGYWMRRYQIDATYEKLDVAPEALGEFFARFRRERLVGTNVTIPHKRAVMSRLDRIEDNARAMGAVNTVWWDGDVLVGGNTDAAGLLASLDEAVPGWDREARRALVLGAGGAARSAAYGLRSRGVAVALCNRTRATAEALAADFDGDVTAHGVEALDALMAEADLFVNATSLGMRGQPALDVDVSLLRDTAIVNDMVYFPVETALLSAAAARGLRTVDGLGMLLHQGAEAFAKWFGVRPEVTRDLRRLVEDDIAAATR